MGKEESGIDFGSARNNPNLRLPFDKLTVLSLPKESFKFQVSSFRNHGSFPLDVEL